MKPKIELKIRDWGDENDSGVELSINNMVIDDYDGDSYPIVQKVLKHLGYEVSTKFINDYGS